MVDSNDVEMASPQPTGDQSSRSRYDLEYNPKRDDAKDVRNTMLVVAALISATTFAAGINPPSGIWQEGTNVGQSILGTQNRSAYDVFFFLNAAAFSSANLVIINLVSGFPYSLEIYGAMFCMSGTYGVSVASVSPPGGSFDSKLIWFAIAVPYVLRIIAYIWKKRCAN